MNQLIGKCSYENVFRELNHTPIKSPNHDKMTKSKMHHSVDTGNSEIHYIAP